MDLDPNYDPSDFLTMHNRRGDNEQQEKGSQFLQNVEIQSGSVPSSNENNSNAHQMPLMMGSHDNMGIDDDLAISESDEEDNGNVRVKREFFSEHMEDEHVQTQQPVNDLQIQQQQFPTQSFVDIEGVKEDYHQEQLHQTQNGSSHNDDNNDDDWLRF